MEKDKDRDERTHDLYGEDDIPELLPTVEKMLASFRITK
jgi:hypothetical protein